MSRACSWSSRTARSTAPAVQTMPFARPQFADLLTAIDFVTEKNYPPRGDVVSLAQAAE